ncbi:Phosphoglycerate mutase family protein [Euphorbia peplus]|nr:Phosphoglycerate mutase family protein [Euphorbia peplus]
MELGEGGDYSLAIHHTDEEMEEWGMSPEMISDQKWRTHAHRGNWNENCPWFYDAFFDNLNTDLDKEGDDKADNSSTTCE